MLLLLKTTQLWLNIYENYFLMPEMFKLSVVILGILQFRNFLSKWCQIFLMALLPGQRIFLVGKLSFKRIA